MTTKNLYDSSFYEDQSQRSLESARVILSRLFPLLNPKRVIDIGCGVGPWLKAAADLGAYDIIGVDGDYVEAEQLMIPVSQFRCADLERTLLRDILADELTERFDLAICVETAEHLSHKRAQSFVEDLTALSDIVLFGAAVPFQSGTYHINEQWPEYWAILFKAQGYECWDFLREEVWSDRAVDWWYAQNTLVFAKKGSVAAGRLLARNLVGTHASARVHPENYLSNLLGSPRVHRAVALDEELHDLYALTSAHQQSASKMPVLQAITRAEAAAAEARNVFPWTRNEVADPDEIIEKIKLEYVALEEVARLQISRRETAERQMELLRTQLEAAEQKYVDIQDLARSEIVRREEAEASLLELNQELETSRQAYVELENLARVEIERREIAESEIEPAQLAYRKLEETVREHAGQREVVEAQLSQLLGSFAASGMHNERDKELVLQLQRQLALAKKQVDTLIEQCETSNRIAASHRAALAQTQAHLDAVSNSTFWRALAPIRKIVSKAPPPLRHFMRRFAKLVWWSVTLKLPAKIRERLRQRFTLAVSAAHEIPHAVAFPDFSPNILSDAEQKLTRFAAFDSEQYFAMHRDIAHSGVSAAWHVVRYGGQEGRALFRDEAVARAIGMLAGSADLVTPHDGFIAAVRSVPIGVYCSSQGNIFMKEIAQDLVADLRASGATATLLDENSSKENRPQICLIVAPHEFFFIGKGTEWLREDIVTGSYMLNTEQVQTFWFSRAMPYLLMARGVIDICAQSAQLLSRAGVNAVSMQFSLLHQPEGVRPEDHLHPLFKVLPKAVQRSADHHIPWEERPLDINFFGAISPYREKFFARHASRFAEYEAFLYCRRNRTPLVADGKDGGLTRIAAHVAAHSKISINIHRDEFGYFEWHRIVKLGMYTGSVVVSDTCLPHSGFAAGVNYFEENHRYIPDLIDWLLRSEEGRAAAQQVLANNEALFSRAPSREETLGPIANFLWGGYQ